jgi:hypothetical protein
VEGPEARDGGRETRGRGLVPITQTEHLNRNGSTHHEANVGKQRCHYVVYRAPTERYSRRCKGMCLRAAAPRTTRTPSAMFVITPYLLEARKRMR